MQDFKDIITKLQFRTGLGRDSHRFLAESTPGDRKKCVLAGIEFPTVPGFEGDSDGDVIFHAICAAITTLTHAPILSQVAPELCKQGITDSRVYLFRAMETMEGQEIQHVALSIEAKRPKFKPRFEEIRTSVAKAMNLEVDQVGLTVTSGDGLTSFGRGEGLLCECIISTISLQ